MPIIITGNWSWFCHFTPFYLCRRVLNFLFLKGSLKAYLASVKKNRNIYILNRYIFISMVSKSTQTLQLEKREFQHSPTLNTVLMIECVLKESGELMTIAELKRRLPRKVMHQTLMRVLDYLQVSGKIVIGTKGVLWVFTERKELDMLIKRGTEI